MIFTLPKTPDAAGGIAVAMAQKVDHIGDSDQVHDMKSSVV